MKGKGRKAFATVLCAVTAMTAGALVACGDDKGKDPLIFEVAETLRVEVGTYFDVPSATGTDKSGNLYFPVITVLDPDGEEVIYESGKFFAAKKGNYTVRYVVKRGDETITDETIVTSSDTTAPEIELKNSEVYELQGSVYTLPAATVRDNYDGAATLASSVSAKFGETEVTVADGKITLDNAGEYKVKYTFADAEGNENSATLTVNSVEKEDGNISYFNHAFAEGFVTPFMTGSLSTSTEKHIEGETNSLRYTYEEAAANAGGFYLNKPLVKDVSAYKYLYFYVYTDVKVAGVTFNGVYSSDRSIVAGAWNKIVLTRSEDGTDYTTPWGTSVFWDPSLNEWQGGAVGDVRDITDFLVFLYLPENSAGDFYFSAIRGTNELPAVDIALADKYSVDDEITLPSATVSGAENVVTKPYIVNNGVATPIDGTFTFEAEGTYNFLFEVVADGKTVGILRRNAFCYVEEAGNVTYFNREFGADNVSPFLGGTVEITDEKHIDGENYSLKYVNTDASYFKACGVVIDTPYIANVSAYSYLYFYYYSDSGVTATPGAQYAAKTDVNGAWTKIIMRNDGNGNFTTDGVASAGITGGNLIGLQLYFYAPGGNATIYISAVRVTNTLDTASVEMPAYAASGEAISIPTATASVTGTVTQKVTVIKPDGTKEIADGATFTPAAQGIYTFVYEVSVNGKLIDSVAKKVAVYEPEEGNISYFNKAFGAGTVGTLNAVAASATTEKHLDGEEYSLGCSLQAPGYWPTMKLDNPYIKDLNAKNSDGEYLYDYVYFFAYTDAANTGIGIHYASAALLKAGMWNRITLVRSGEGFTYNGVSIFGEDGKTANDITGLQILFDTNKETAWTAVYLSAIRAVKTLPSITGVADKTCFVGDEVAINPASTADGCTIQAFKDGAEFTASAFTPEAEGNYTFDFVLKKDGKIYDTARITIGAEAKEFGNITGTNTRHALEIASNCVNTTLKISETETHNGEQVLEWSLPWAGTWGYLTFNNPFITNLNEKDGEGNYLYDYVYFYVKSDKITQIGTETAYAINITAGEWTRVVFTRSGENFIVPIHDGTSPVAFESADDINGFKLRAVPAENTNVIYLSAIRACKTLPAD